MKVGVDKEETEISWKGKTVIKRNKKAQTIFLMLSAD